MGLKILIGEDEKDIAQTLQDCLESRGFKVAMAVTGVEVIEKLSTDQFDVVLLDIGMPGLDGLQTLEQIRKSDRNIIVIMTTGFAENSALAKTADHYLVKPFNVSELSTIIERKVKLLAPRSDG